MRESWRAEIGPMLGLAVPVVLGEIGWIAMGVVDVMMVGRIDAESIGAVSVGRALFMFVAVFAIGLLFGLDTVVAQAWGAGDAARSRRGLVQGVWLCAALAVPMMVVSRALGSGLEAWHVDPRVRAEAVAYLDAVSWSSAPLVLYVAFRRYLQAVNAVRPVMIALVTANAVNVVGNWVLIFGNLGAPALGAAGAAWSTIGAMAYLALFLLVAILVHDRAHGRELGRVSLRPNGALLRRLVGLGLPAAVQHLLEVGVFALATVLAARLNAASLAAHQIALNAASVTFMVPLGVSSAAAVRVGQAVGRRDPRGAAISGWTALGLGTAFMAVAAVAFVAVPEWIVRAFTTDPDVVRAGVTLLLLAAVFQMFDGMQIVATGALRGAGETRGPMAWALVGYWGLGLPTGWILAFRRGYGVAGLWVGLCVGLVVVGSILVATWARAASPAGRAARLGG